MGKSTNKRAIAKIKRAGTGESAGGPVLSPVSSRFFFRFALRARFLLSLSLYYLGTWNRLHACSPLDRGQTREICEKQENYFKGKVVTFTVQSLLLYQYPADLLTFLKLY